MEGEQHLLDLLLIPGESDLHVHPLSIPLPCLHLVQHEVVLALGHPLVHVLPHLFDPIPDRHSEAVEAVVVGEASPVPRDPAHLVHKLVFEGRLRREALGREVVVPKDEVLVDDELVLVHDGFEGVDDPRLFLFAVLDLFDDAGMGLREEGADKFREHAVAVVRFDDDVVDGLLLGELDDGCEDLITIPVALIGPHGRDVQIAVQHLYDAYGGFVLAPSCGVNRHDGACVREPCAVEEGGTIIPAVPVQADAGDVVQDVCGSRRPYGFLRGVGGRARHDDQVPDLEGVLLHVGQPGVEHELELEPGASIRQLTLEEVVIREAARVRGASGKGRGGFKPLEDKGCQSFVAVVDELVFGRIPCGPHADGIPTVGQGVVERLFGLRRAEIGDGAAGFQDGVEFLDRFRELVPHGLREAVVRNFNIVSNDLVGTTARDLREDAFGRDARRVVGPCGAYVERELRAPLVGAGDEALEDGDFIDEPHAERREVVGAVLRCGQHHELEVRVPAQPPDDVGRRDPRFAHAPEGFDDLSSRPVLEVQGDVELDGRGVGKVQVTPDERKEDPEVGQLLRHRGNGRRGVRNKTSFG